MWTPRLTLALFIGVLIGFTLVMFIR